MASGAEGESTAESGRNGTKGGGTTQPQGGGVGNFRIVSSAFAAFEKQEMNQDRLTDITDNSDLHRHSKMSKDSRQSKMSKDSTMSLDTRRAGRSSKGDVASKLIEDGHDETSEEEDASPFAVVRVSAARAEAGSQPDGVAARSSQLDDLTLRDVEDDVEEASSTRPTLEDKDELPHDAAATSSSDGGRTTTPFAQQHPLSPPLSPPALHRSLSSPKSPKHSVSLAEVLAAPVDLTRIELDHQGGSLEEELENEQKQRLRIRSKDVDVIDTTDLIDTPVDSDIDCAEVAGEVGSPGGASAGVVADVLAQAVERRARAGEEQKDVEGEEGAGKEGGSSSSSGRGGREEEGPPEEEGAENEGFERDGVQGRLVSATRSSSSSSHSGDSASHSGDSEGFFSTTNEEETVLQKLDARETRPSEAEGEGPMSSAASSSPGTTEDEAADGAAADGAAADARNDTSGSTSGEPPTTLSTQSIPAVVLGKEEEEEPTPVSRSVVDHEKGDSTDKSDVLEIGDSGSQSSLPSTRASAAEVTPGSNSSSSRRDPDQPPSSGSVVSSSVGRAGAVGGGSSSSGAPGTRSGAPSSRDEEPLPRLNLFGGMGPAISTRPPRPENSSSKNDPFQGSFAVGVAAAMAKDLNDFDREGSPPSSSHQPAPRQSPEGPPPAGGPPLASTSARSGAAADAASRQQSAASAGPSARLSAASDHGFKKPQPVENIYLSEHAKQFKRVLVKKHLAILQALQEILQLNNLLYEPLVEVYRNCIKFKYQATDGSGWIGASDGIAIGPVLHARFTSGVQRLLMARDLVASLLLSGILDSRARVILIGVAEQGLDVNRISLEVWEKEIGGALFKMLKSGDAEELAAESNTTAK